MAFSSVAIHKCFVTIWGFIGLLKRFSEQYYKGLVGLPNIFHKITIRGARKGCHEGFSEVKSMKVLIGV